METNLKHSLKHRWLTIPEAMAYSRVKNRKTIIKWIESGLIYGHKRTGSWVVDRESIDKWYLEDQLEQARPIETKGRQRTKAIR